MDLLEIVIRNGFGADRARRAMEHVALYEGDLPAFIRSVSDIMAREDLGLESQTPQERRHERSSIVANHTGYDCAGGENFEHDDTGSQMNYSGVEDEVNNALADHEGWQEGFDY